MNYTEAPRNSAVYVSAISTLNQVVFKKKKLKKKKEKETPSLVDHQIGMGLNNNFIQALSLYSAPTLCIFSYQKNTLLGQPFLSIMNSSVEKHLLAVYQKRGSLSLHTHPMVYIPDWGLHPILLSPALTTDTQFSPVTQSCPTLCDPMNRSTPGLPGHHQLPEFTQTQVHRVSDAIQPSHPLSSPSPPTPNPSQHQSLFQWVNSSHEVAKVLEFQLHHRSLQRNPPCSPRDSQESSPTPQFKSIKFFGAQPSS